MLLTERLAKVARLAERECVLIEWRKGIGRCREGREIDIIPSRDSDRRCELLVLLWPMCLWHAPSKRLLLPAYP